MARSAADLLALKSELTNDPLTLGLDTNPAHDEANADKLNLVRDTIAIKKRSLTAAALFNSIDDLEHQALSDQQARWLEAVLLLGQLDPFRDMNLLDGINRLFGDKTASRTNIATAAVESGNRIDQLFQGGKLEVGGTVTPSDIANARAA
jgi:hypothetical protein